MKDRLENKFKELKNKRKKAFIAFITAGDPNLKTTQELVIAFEKSGVDIIELGVPFSDPLADGPTIQAASQRALKNKVTLGRILKAVSQIREKTQIPIVLMTYYNPVFYFGEQRLMRQARISGVDGLIIPDLPPEEASSIIRYAKKDNIAMVFFLSPTTQKKRMKKIAQATSGFIYYVSLTGVTGARETLPSSVARNVRLAKHYTNKPICVGFGVSNAAQVRSVARVSDGVIIGSAIVNQIILNSGSKHLVKNVTAFVSKLAKGLQR